MLSCGISKATLVACGLGLMVGSALADTLTFSNGDQLRGRVLSEDGERLVFQPELLPQKLEIPRSSIVKIELDSASSALAVEDDAESKASGSKASASEETLAPAVAKDHGADSPSETAEASSGKLLPELPENWDARLGFGFTDRDNQSVKTRELSAKGKLAWKGERQEAEWKAHYQYQSQEGKKSADRYGASQRLRHRGPDSFYVQAETNAEVDQVTKKRSQVSQTAGLGYSPIKEKGLTLNVTPGIKVEVITDADREEQEGKAYKAHVQQDFKWEVNDRVAIGQGLSYSVDPRNTDNWDLDLKAFVETKVSEDVNVRLNYHREFVNQTVGAEDKENAAVGASLVWDF